MVGLHRNLLGTRPSRHHGRFLGKHVAQYGQKVHQARLVPERRPARQVRVVHHALWIDVLAGPHGHGVGRRDVDDGRVARVGVRHPYRHGEAVRRAAEHDRERAREVHQECRLAVRRRVHVGTRRQRRVCRQGLCDVVVGPVDVVVFLPTSADPRCAKKKKKKKHKRTRNLHLSGRCIASSTHAGELP